MDCLFRFQPDPVGAQRLGFVDQAAHPMRLLAAVDHEPQAARGTGPTRREPCDGEEHGWQQPRAMASESEQGHVGSTVKRRTGLAGPTLVNCSGEGLTGSNRRIRNRMYGGVGGADERLSPLS